MNESIWISELVREIGYRIAAKQCVPRELVRPIGSPVIRRFSITQRFTLDIHDNSKVLIAKTRRFASKSNFADAVSEPRTQRLVKLEYETHRKAFAIFSKHESMSVPALYDLQKDLATIVMEAVSGASLARSVSSLGILKRIRGKHLEQDFFNAGAWLRIFQEGIAKRDPVVWQRESLDGVVSDHLDALQNDGVGQQRRDNVAGIFDRRLNEVDGRTTQSIGTIHGDFKPAHVLIDDRELAVIDFGTTRAEFGAVDAGNFLADLSCNAYGPRLVRREKLEKLAERFLAGYNIKNRADSVVRLYCGANLLRLWRKRRQRFPNGTPLRKIDSVIDLSGSRGLLNRTYVDKWFERTITVFLA